MNTISSIRRSYAHIANASQPDSKTLADRQLSGWPVSPGFVWIQAREPKYARKLSRRSDSRLVAWGVAGGFLRTFEFQHGKAWMKKLIARYLGADAKATNERKSRLKRPPSSRMTAGVVLTPETVLRGSKPGSNRKIRAMGGRVPEKRVKKCASRNEVVG